MWGFLEKAWWPSEKNRASHSPGVGTSTHPGASVISRCMDRERSLGSLHLEYDLPGPAGMGLCVCVPAGLACFLTGSRCVLSSVDVQLVAGQGGLGRSVAGNCTVMLSHPGSSWLHWCCSTDVSLRALRVALCESWSPFLAAASPCRAAAGSSDSPISQEVFLAAALHPMREEWPTGMPPGSCRCLLGHDLWWHP